MRQSRRAFTLLELLVTVAIIGILAALLLPALQRATIKARQTWCTSNLRQVGIGLSSFAHDHNGLYPQQISRLAGGALENARSNLFLEGRFTVSAAAFSVLSNELGNARVLGCPATKRAPARFTGIAPPDLGFALAMTAASGDAMAPLALDRNVDVPRTQAGRRGTPNRDTVIFWTPERHANRGNALFADGHVEQRVNLPLAGRGGGITGSSGTVGPPNSGNSAGLVGGAGAGHSGAVDSPTAVPPASPASPPSAPSAPAVSGFPGHGSRVLAGNASPTIPATIPSASPSGARPGIDSPAASPPAPGASGGSWESADPDEEPWGAKLRRSVLWIFLVIFLLGLGAVLFHAWQRYRALQSSG